MRQNTSDRSGRRCRHLVAVAVAAVGVGARGSHAAVLGFDSDANAANGATDGGGAWDTTTANWFNGSTDVVWPNTAADTAVFGAGGTGGTVNVSTVNAGTIQFNVSGYNLAGGTINLSTGATPGLISIAAGQTATINSAFANGNTAGLNVNGVGNTASTYTTGTLTLGGTFSQQNLNLVAGGLNLAGSSGNTFTLNNGTFNLGGVTTNVATGNIYGAETFAFGFLNVGTGSSSSVPGSGTGTLNISSGATATVAGSLQIGRSANGTGTVTVTDAVVTVAAAAASTKNTYVAQNGTAVLTVNGTSTFTDNAATIVDLGQGAAGNGTVNVADTAAFTAVGSVRVGDAGVGTVNVQGGTFNASAGVLLGNATSGVGTVNLTGGTLYALSVAKGASKSAVFNFSGGTLATLPKSPAAFMTGLTAAYVNVGGAAIDTTNAGVTIAQPLLAPAGGGTDGGLTKLGGNTLTLAGANTYAGATNVSAGTLAIGAGGGIANSVRINAGTTAATAATLDVSAAGLTLAAGQALGGTGFVVGATTVGNNSTITAGPDGATTGTLNVSGGTQTWAAGGTFVAKVAPTADGSTVASNDLLSLSALSITAGTNGFNVSIPSTTGTATTYAAPIVIVDVTGGANPFTATTLASLSLSTPGLQPPSADRPLQLSEQGDGSGGYDLVVVAAPEPTSLALLGVAAIPLIGARRRRRTMAAGSGPATV